MTTEEEENARERREFNAALNEMRRHIPDAIETLYLIMTAQDTAVIASSRLRAAQIYLETSISIHRMVELEEKYNALEKMIKSAHSDLDEDTEAGE